MATFSSTPITTLPSMMSAGGRKTFRGYNEAKLREAAEMTLGSLSRLGVTVPTVDDLIADFYGRL
jgi:hypothetical protein